MTGLPLHTASMAGNHCSCSRGQYPAHYGLGPAAWPQSVKNKTGLFSSTVISYQLFKKPKQSQFHICMLEPVTVFLAVSKGAAGEGRVRSRRGILELAGAIRCSTGRSPFAFLRYGCYCGLGGKGWPMDRVDW